RAALAVDNARLYASARAAIQGRDQLIAIVSHDLRSPLGAIGLIASLLRRRHADARTREQLEVIVRSVERMETMIGDLLDMSRLEAGRLPLELRPADAGALVREAISAHAIAAAERGLEIHGDAAAARVRCDPARIAQVLGNLLGNAIKFGRRGDRISVRAAIEDDRARFEVSDTGPGIAAEDLPYVFEPFWSAQAPAGARDGIGLGLYISRRCGEAHGGQIRAESEPGRGTTVSFTLPPVDQGAA